MVRANPGGAEAPQNRASMKVIKIIPTLCAVLLFAAAACQTPVITHKLVATGNQHSIPLYPDESAFLKYSRMRQQGGVEGMVGDIGNKMVAKNIDDQTPIKIVSSDDNGAVVQITDGPMRGQTGFVGKQNVD
jgi:hypothetical protein